MNGRSLDELLRDLSAELAQQRELPRMTVRTTMRSWTGRFALVMWVVVILAMLFAAQGQAGAALVALAVGTWAVVFTGAWLAFLCRP